MKITLGSLFDGIGGFPLAASRYGIKALWASEIEPFPIKVTKTRLPDMRHLGDITKINGSEIEPVDIITFGSPCQDLSVAGKRAGLAGERSGLFMEAVRIIKEMRSANEGSDKPIRPRFAVWENVPGAFSSNKGEDFRAVLEEICHVKDETVIIPGPPKGKWNTVGAIMGNGYSIAWRILDAQYWGVPQRRRRIFLVADFGGQSAPEILFKQEGLSRHLTEGGEAREGITADAERSAPKTMLVRCGCRGGGKGPLIQDDKSATLSTLNTQTLFQPTEPIIFEPRSQDGVPRIHDEVVSTLNTAQGGQRQPCICLQGSMIGRAEKNGPQGDGINEDVSFTLNTTDRHAVATKVYGICSYASNSMKSDNPHSGIYEAETSRTLDLNGGSPACNQGGMAIVQCVEPGALSRGQGERVWDKCPTLRANMGDNQPCVVLNDQGGSQMSVTEDKVNTLRAEMHGNIPAVATYQKVSGPLMANSHPGSYTGQDAYTDMLVTPYQETVGSLCARDYKGIGNQYVSEDKCIITPKYSARRLTPLECERLQGFPDGWTDIEGASDSGRYKALGNSVAIPCVEYVMEGIAQIESTER